MSCGSDCSLKASRYVEEAARARLREGEFSICCKPETVASYSISPTASIHDGQQLCIQRGFGTAKQQPHTRHHRQNPSPRHRQRAQTPLEHRITLFRCFRSLDRSDEQAALGGRAALLSSIKVGPQCSVRAAKRADSMRTDSATSDILRTWVGLSVTKPWDAAFCRSLESKSVRSGRKGNWLYENRFNHFRYPRNMDQSDKHEALRVCAGLLS